MTSEEKLKYLKELRDHPGWPLFLEVVNNEQKDIDSTWLSCGELSEYRRGQRVALLSICDMLLCEIDNLVEIVKENPEEE